jgi:Flp pilus assembly protein TadG
MMALLARVLHWRRLASDRRGVVALWMGLTTPVLIMAMGMGIEVGDWATAKVSLQRTADAAALTGIYYYQTNTGQTGLAQKAATAAANVALINGASGGTASWNAASQKLTNNQVTAQIVPGIKNAGDIAMKVTVNRTVSLAIGKIFKSDPSIALSATSIAEIVAGSSGDSVCMLALQGDINGVTTTQDVTISGNVTVDAGNCGLRSDASVTVSGNVHINTKAIYAAGTYTKTGAAVVTATDGIQTNAGQIPDPLLSNSTLQSAMTAAKNIASTVQSISCTSSSCTGPAGCCTANTPSAGVTTINHGSYGGLSASGQAKIAMPGGLYSFRDDVTISGGTQLTATSVTIVTGGKTGSSFSGTSQQTLTAATTATVANGAIAGIAFATGSTRSTSFSGTTGTDFAGLIYQPNGSVTISGTATDGTAGCGEIVANDITLSGTANTTVAPNCDNYGLPTIYGLPATSYVALVE